MKLRQRWRIIGATLLAAVLTFGGAATAASAAPPYETDATLTSVQFASATVQSGSTTRIDGSWSLPNNPATPAGFVIELPTGLEGLTDTFPLLAPNGDVMGTCTVGADQLFCDISSAYVAAHPVNLSGTFNFWATVTTRVAESTQVTYDFGGVTDSIIVIPAAGPCIDCTFDGQWNEKYGFYDRDDDSIWWLIDIESPVTGMAGGETVSVRELLGPNQELQSSGGVPNITVLGTNEVDENGYPDYEVSVDIDFDLTETPEGWVATFVTEPGWFYSLDVYVDVTNAGAPGAGRYTNQAEITIGSAQPETVRSEVVRQGGGGTGSGEGFGDFTITKIVNWGEQPVGGITFTGTYTVTAPDGSVTVEGAPFSVAEGATWTSEGYEAGSTVHLEEILPTEPSNLTWATPVFSSNDFVLGDQTTIDVTLTNEASVDTGVFEASKVLAGDAASLVADDAVFFLDYSYPAGNGFEAGSGTLELPANGEVATSGALPVGAVIALTERNPETVRGATWAAPVLSIDTVTIGEDEVVSVTVTNTLTLNTNVFRASKVLAGDGAGLVADDAVFFLDYSYPAGNGFEAGSGTLELPANGDVVTSGALPVGARLTLTERAPDAIAGATWAAPVLSTASVTINERAPRQVTVTNTIALETGVFEASKVLAGDGAGLVADDAVFFLDYSYPAGNGFEAGSGTLELPANGDVVTSGALPVGARLTLTERAPDAIAGATWAAPVLSIDTVTIGEGEGVSVTVTNTLTLSAGIPSEGEGSAGGGTGSSAGEGTGPSTGDETGSSTSTGPTAGLALTGGQMSIIVLAVGAAFVAVGGGILVFRRSRTSE